MKKLHYSPELEECVTGHYTAVVEEDEYRIQELAQGDKDIEYIVDLGANVGMASMHIQTFYPDAKIICCEPEPECMKYAKLNTDNKLIYAEEAVIGDDRKEVVFNVCKWGGNGHVDGNFRWDLFKPMGSEKVKEIKVPACTLKELMDKYEFPRIDLLKIDTEGMEGQILTNFKPHLHLVKHIRGEWHGDIDREMIKNALRDTHDFYINQSLTTHGDVFAILKGNEVIFEKNGYEFTKRLGLPSKIKKL